MILHRHKWDTGGARRRLIHEKPGLISEEAEILVLVRTETSFIQKCVDCGELRVRTVEGDWAHLAEDGGIA